MVALKQTTSGKNDRHTADTKVEIFGYNGPYKVTQIELVSEKFYPKYINHATIIGNNW